MAIDRELRITGPMHDRFDEILTPEALDFIAVLDGVYAERRCAVLGARTDRWAAIADGLELDFLPKTASVRNDDSWRVAPPAPGLVDRRVEITGPPTRRMTINALNSGAKVWLADFEDATTPTWTNIIEGQLNLVDALERRIDFTTPEGKEYRLGNELPTIVVRPRGLHLCEKHVLIDGRPVPAAFVDFGLYVFHNARRLIEGGTGPYFYLPKLESHLEARLWNDVFTLAESYLGLECGTIRATVLIETITAAFEMDEILYELREHAAGLNAGRWDYIFSIIKTFRSRGDDYVLPDRSDLTMTAPFMRAYTDLLVETCHRRGAMAIGGMAAFVPDRTDPEITREALAKVREDKQREAGDGFDGSWVAHPDLVPVCRDVFDATLGDRPNQLERPTTGLRPTPAELLAFTDIDGAVTERGLRQNLSVSLRYLEAWLRGNGAVAIDHLMEDAATVEISRSQVWQWINAGTTLQDGRQVDRSLVDTLLAEELSRICSTYGAAGQQHRLEDAATLFREIAMEDEFPTFFTGSAYARYLVDTVAATV